MQHINLEENKAYTLAEVVEIVQNTLESVKENAKYCEMQFSPGDIYWLLRNLLTYVNRNVPGEFALRRNSKGSYRVRYRTEELEKIRAAKKVKEDLRKSADYLEELTGNRPNWG